MKKTNGPNFRPTGRHGKSDFSGRKKTRSFALRVFTRDGTQIARGL